MILILTENGSHEGSPCSPSPSVAGLLTGCSAGADEATPGQVTVAASFYPLAWVSEQIAPRARVTDLTRPGLEPHDVELTFAQTVDLAKADLVVYERGFQPAVDQGVDNDAEGVEPGRRTGRGPEGLRRRTPARSTRTSGRTR